VQRLEIRAWISDAWDKVREVVLRDLSGPSRRVRRALAAAIGSVGRHFPPMPRCVSDWRDRDREHCGGGAAVARRTFALRLGSSAALEPQSFSGRIEAAVGADMQFIRINGTIVGGLVGAALYAMSLLAR
jgi:uncharacterized membrane-anchored protein YjiN (DUF445 family)